MQHYFQSLLNKIDRDLNDEDFSELITYNYLYLGSVAERFSIHHAERIQGPDFSQPQVHGWMIYILRNKSRFEAALKEKAITSIVPCPRKWLYDETTEASKKKFLENLAKLQSERGILNTLLVLHNTAFFPEKIKGAKWRSLMAASYLKLVLAYLERCLDKDKKITPLLKWCGKKSLKILTWRIKQKDKRHPSKASIQIHFSETARFIKYFLQLACNPKNKLWSQHVEMLIFMSLALACARARSKFFGPKDILKVTKDDLGKHRIQEDQLKIIRSYKATDVREKSKSSAHDAHVTLLLKLPLEFLKDDRLWPGATELNDDCCINNAVKVKNSEVLISDSLAYLIEHLGGFTISTKDVENRLKEAYQVIGLKQSSGGVSTRCFFVQPHYWEGVDLRKDYK